ncbi:hypothetical protein FKP32DRAFT_1588147 [Trametes sanguinea]|nr:hypothetical protein FKP32DRAFT_1588147 [Trametes sanguinea]
MHQCLQIEEIIAAIFTQLDEYVIDPQIVVPPRVLHRDTVAVQTLASLASTCRTFREPALDVLWRSIPDLNVLIESFMPTELLIYDRVYRQLYMLRDPDEATWMRLDPYIQRIRAIGVPTQPSGLPYRTLDAETVLRPMEIYLKRRSLGSRPLIPHLQFVVFHPFWINEYYARLLIHPRLAVLHWPTKAFLPVRRAGGSPDGEDLDVSGLWDILAELSTQICLALVRSECLHTLWIKAVTWNVDAFSHLSRLETLTSLALESGWSSVIEFPLRSELQFRPFPALKQLLISVAHGEAERFLEYIQPYSLDAVAIYCDDPTTDGGGVLKRILALLARLSQPCHIRVVAGKALQRAISYWDPSLIGRSAFEFLDDVNGLILAPAFSMNSLRTLEIGTDMILNFQSYDILLYTGVFAQNLPHLESLSLVPALDMDLSRGRLTRDVSHMVHNTHTSWPSLSSLTALLHLVQCCPRLTRLKLAVEGSIYVDLAYLDPPDDEIRLRHMELWATDLDQGLADEIFVRFFATHFPGLDILHVILPFAAADDAASTSAWREKARLRWDAVIHAV